MSTRTTTPVIAAGLLLLALFLSPTLQAGGRRRVVAASQTSPLAIQFLGNDGLLDAGRISWDGTKRSTIRTRTVTLRIGPPAREVRGTTNLLAFLELTDQRCTVRVNGITIGNTPRVVQRDVPIGIATTQRIEIEVPVDAPEGALQLSIGWSANE